jgi:hypothetical protein
MNLLKNSTNEKNSLSNRFSTVATNAFCTCFLESKNSSWGTCFMHTLSPIYDNQFFPENYAVLYDSLALAKFDMFKDEIPKLRDSRRTSFDKIKMSLD